jgi:arginase
MGAVLVEVPFNSAGTANGVARMPAALRDAGLHDVMPALDHVVAVDVGDLVPERGPSGFRAEDALVRAVTGAQGAVLRAVAGGRVPVVVGGDCPVLLGPLAALAEAGHRPGLVFVDGHEDAWPPALSPTGEAADSELGIALGLVPGPAGLADVLPAVAAGDVAVLGPRDRAELDAAGCPTLAGRVALVAGDALADPDDAAVAAAVRDAVAAAAEGTGAWWFHVDLDVLSTDALPAVDYPQPGGIGWERLELVADAATAVPGCAGASVVIYNPDLDRGAAAPRIARFVAFLADALVRAANGPAATRG